MHDSFFGQIAVLRLLLCAMLPLAAQIPVQVCCWQVCDYECVVHLGLTVWLAAYMARYNTMVEVLHAISKSTDTVTRTHALINVVKLDAGSFVATARVAFISPTPYHTTPYHTTPSHPCCLFLSCCVLRASYTGTVLSVCSLPPAGRNLQKTV